MQDDKSVLTHFFAGIVFVVLVQTAFMLGGLLVERRMGVPITGIPSAAGLTLVLVLGALAARRTSIYLLMGSFALAFIAPLILLLIVLTKPASMPFLTPHTYGSLGYMAALCVAVWLYFVARILRGRI